MLSGGDFSHRLPPRSYLRLLASVFLYYFLVPHLPAQQTQYTIDLYTIENGLAHNSILWIEKDRYGYIWTRSHIGISRFDGIRFTSYLPDLTKGLVDDVGKVEIECNPKGELWFINKRIPAARYDYLHDSFLWLYNVSPGQEVHQIPFREHSGKLWVYTSSALYKMAEVNGDSVYIASEFHPDKEIGEILDMYEFLKGYLWLSTSTGLYFMKESSERIELTRYDLKIQDLNPEPAKFDRSARIIPWEDKLWICTEGKILLADSPVPPADGDDHVIPCEQIILDRPDIELGRDQTVFTIAWDGVRNLYFRTIKGVYGYSVITKEIERIYVEDYEIFVFTEGAFLDAMKYDPDGILWAGTDRGLLKITIGNKHFHVIQPDPLHPDGLNYPRLNAVLVDRNKHLWVGTSGDGLYRGIPDPEGKYHDFKHYLPDPDDSHSLRSKHIHRLLEDSRGNIWLTGDNTQTIDLSGITPRFFDTPFLPCDGAICEDPRGNILEPSWNICWLLQSNTSKIYQLYPDKNNPDIKGFEFCMADDSSCYMIAKGRLYQSEGPLLFFEASEDDTIPYAYPESSTLLLEDSTIYVGKQFLVTVYEDYKEIWLQAGRYPTLRRYRLPGNHSSPSKLELVNAYNIGNGLSDNWIYEMIEDRNKRIWITTQNGLTCIDPATENIYRYYEEDGLPTNRFWWSSCQDRNGSIYLCTVNGLVYFHPDSIFHDPPPPVYITGLSINNQPFHSGIDSPLEEEIMHTDRISLPHHQNFLSFEFAALDYTNTD